MAPPLSRGASQPPSLSLLMLVWLPDILSVYFSVSFSVSPTGIKYAPGQSFRNHPTISQSLEQPLTQRRCGVFAEYTSGVQAIGGAGA